MEEYIKLLNRLQQEQRELYVLRDEKSKTAFFTRSKLTMLIKEYDKAILDYLRKMEQVIDEEHTFSQKLKKAIS